MPVGAGCGIGHWEDCGIDRSGEVGGGGALVIRTPVV
jgi:hypothetical protein